MRVGRGKKRMCRRGHVRSDAPRTALLPGKLRSQIYKHMYSTSNLMERDFHKKRVIGALNQMMTEGSSLNEIRSACQVRTKKTRHRSCSADVTRHRLSCLGMASSDMFR